MATKSAKKTSTNYVATVDGKTYLPVSQVLATTKKSSSSSSSTTNNPDYSAGSPHVNFKNPTKSGRDITVEWTWDRNTHKYTDHYDVVWYYYTPSNKKWDSTSTSTREPGKLFATYTPPANASKAKVKVRPVQKKEYKDPKTKKKTKPKGKIKWTGAWGISKWIDVGEQASIPPAPDIKEIYITGSKLYLTVENYKPDGAKLTFEIIREVSANKREKFGSASATVNYGRAVASIDIKTGYKYYARCKAEYKGYSSTSWSNWSEITTSAPSKPTGVTATARDVDPDQNIYRILVEWKAVANVTDVQNDKYQVAYTKNEQYFDTSPDDVKIIDVPNDDKPRTKIDITLQEAGTWYFRVRGHNIGGDGPWSSIVNAAIGSKPEAPTTWSYTSNVEIGQPIIFNWTHNSSDGSKQDGAQLWVTVNGSPLSGYNPKVFSGKDKETKQFSFPTTGLPDSATVEWQVATKGAHKDYSDKSVLREVKIYEPPTVSVSVRETNGVNDDPSEITQYPIDVTIDAGPESQKLVSLDFSIIAASSYSTVDETGEWMYVSEGDVVYSKRIDNPESNTIEFTLTPGDVNLMGDMDYTARADSYMDSSLTAYGTNEFHVSISGEEEFEPEGTVEINFNTLTAKIYPFCRDEFDAELVGGGKFTVFRQNFDGTYTEIDSGIELGYGTVAVDRHPTLDYARYRVVLTSEATGRAYVADLSPEEVGADCIVMNWMEDVAVLDNTIDENDDSIILGDMLKLPYNVDVSDSNNMDVALIEYIGREYPVSYYGTQKGYTSNWKCEIRKDDSTTLYAIRRLARYAGDVYVREPNGSGYWAQVKVQYSINHKTTTIPVSFTVTRVEGGE